MLAKLRSLFHLSVATLFGLGGASAAVLSGQEPPLDPPAKSRDAEPEIILAEAKTVEATDSLQQFLDLYAGPPPKPVVVKNAPVVKKAPIKNVTVKKHKVTKKVVKTHPKRTVVKQKRTTQPLFGNPAPGRGY
jgi:hypothetical protein